MKVKQKHSTLSGSALSTLEIFPLLSCEQNDNARAIKSTLNFQFEQLSFSKKSFVYILLYT